MRFRGRKNMFQRFTVLIFAFEVYKECEAITNADFNTQIRDYAVVENNLTSSDVKTLQKKGLGLSGYANIAPVQNPVKFRDVPDNIISESSHGRGLLHQDPIAYGFDYEEPHYGHGYEYQPHDAHHDPHDYHHHDFHEPGHHLSSGHHHGYGHHHKHYDHGLATKALLWPIAGIALLGAAAALVSNPVLLQLGVVSGKRRRRHVEEIEDIAKNSIKKWSQLTVDHNEEHGDDNLSNKVINKRMLRKDDFKVVKRVMQGKGASPPFENKNDPKRYSEEDRQFIPIPLMIKKT